MPPDDIYRSRMERETYIHRILGASLGVSEALDSDDDGGRESPAGWGTCPPPSSRQQRLRADLPSVQAPVFSLA